jgi:putative ABC transport system substrate-binding protein
MRRIGALMNFRSDGPEGQARIAAFIQALQKLGWNEGANVRTDVRWAGDDAERYRKYSEELLELNPDVILASASPSVGGVAGGHPKRANCVRECRRPGWCRVRQQLGTAGW